MTANACSTWGGSNGVSGGLGLICKGIAGKCEVRIGENVMSVASCNNWCTLGNMPSQLPFEIEVITSGAVIGCGTTKS